MCKKTKEEVQSMKLILNTIAVMILLCCCMQHSQQCVLLFGDRKTVTFELSSPSSPNVYIVAATLGVKANIVTFKKYCVST
jgi:hypothetical protein